MLGLAIRAATGPGAPLVLIERNAVRNKADRSLRKQQQQQQQQEILVAPAGGGGDANLAADGSGAGSGGGEFLRARVDLRDLWMAGIPWQKRQQQQQQQATHEETVSDAGSAGGNMDVMGGGRVASGGAAASSSSAAASSNAAPLSSSAPVLSNAAAANLYPLVAVAKHLCGVATDLGLRALLTRSDGGSASGVEQRLKRNRADVCDGGAGNAVGAANKVEGGNLDDYDNGDDDNGDDYDDDWPGRGRSALGSDLNLQGVCIATCCHHCCAWEDYVGRGWFKAELGFGQLEFNRLKQWSGWACSSNGSSSSSSSNGISSGSSDSDARVVVLSADRGSLRRGVEMAAAASGAPVPSHNGAALVVPPLVVHAEHHLNMGGLNAVVLVLGHSQPPDGVSSGSAGSSGASRSGASGGANGGSCDDEPSEKWKGGNSGRRRRGVLKRGM